MPDELNFGKLRKGDSAAWCQVIDQFSEPLGNLIKSKVNDSVLASEAGDILQDVFLSAISSSNTLDANSTPKLVAWLMKIAGNKVIDYQRRLNNRPKRQVLNSQNSSKDLPIQDPGRSPASAAGQIELNGKLHAAMQLLPEDHRKIVTRRAFGEETFETIATSMGMSTSRAHQIFKGSILKLKDILEKKPGSAGEQA